MEDIAGGGESSPWAFVESPLMPANTRREFIWLMRVFIDGIHILTLIDPVEQDGEIVARFQVIHRDRFAQKMGYIRRGQRLAVLAGGRKGYIEAEASCDRIKITLARRT